MGEVKGGQEPSELRAPRALPILRSTMADEDLNDLCSFLMAEMFSPLSVVEKGEGMGVKYQALCVLTWFS